MNEDEDVAGSSTYESEEQYSGVTEAMHSPNDDRTYPSPASEHVKQACGLSELHTMQLGSGPVKWISKME